MSLLCDEQFHPSPFGLHLKGTYISEKLLEMLWWPLIYLRLVYQYPVFLKHFLDELLPVADVSQCTCLCVSSLAPRCRRLEVYQIAKPGWCEVPRSIQPSGPGIASWPLLQRASPASASDLVKGCSQERHSPRLWRRHRGHTIMIDGWMGLIDVGSPKTAKLTEFDMRGYKIILICKL